MNASQLTQQTASMPLRVCETPASFVVQKALNLPAPSTSNPIPLLAVALALVQTLALPAPIVVWNIAPAFVAPVWAAIVGAHFLPYAWMQRSRWYVSLAILVPALAWLWAVVLGVGASAPLAPGLRRFPNATAEPCAQTRDDHVAGDRQRESKRSQPPGKARFGPFHTPERHHLQRQALANPGGIDPQQDSQQSAFRALSRHAPCPITCGSATRNVLH